MKYSLAVLAIIGYFSAAQVSGIQQKMKMDLEQLTNAADYTIERFAENSLVHTNADESESDSSEDAMEDEDARQGANDQVESQ